MINKHEDSSWLSSMTRNKREGRTIRRHDFRNQNVRSTDFRIVPSEPLIATKLGRLKKAFFDFNKITSKCPLKTFRRRRNFLSTPCNIFRFQATRQKTFGSHLRYRKKYFQEKNSLVEILDLVRGAQVCRNCKRGRNFYQFCFCIPKKISESHFKT